ncbi:hypothetical protein L7F22_022853 [Adiantum nelumboides]|nr:hypothetical protein [Adiantum nelumboides]
MLRRLHATGADVELHYFARSAERAAFHDLLTTGPLAAHTRTHLGLDPAGTTAVLDDLLGRPGDDERVHVCGPAGLIDAVHAAARRHGRPPGPSTTSASSPSRPCPRAPPGRRRARPLRRHRHGRDGRVGARRPGPGGDRRGPLLRAGRLRHLCDRGPERRDRAPRLVPDPRGTAGRRPDGAVRVALRRPGTQLDL